MLRRIALVFLVELIAHMASADNPNHATVGSLSMHPGSWKSMTVINTGFKDFGHGAYNLRVREPLPLGFFSLPVFLLGSAEG